MKGKRVAEATGITLIALVITIIVMLILVAVTISVAINGGLFDYAKRVKEKTATSQDLEKEFTSIEQGLNYTDLIDKYTIGEGILTKNEEYTDENDAKAVIPKGFRLTDKNIVADGLVIEDKYKNQFVWIPVNITGDTMEEKISSFDSIRTTKPSTLYIEPEEHSSEEYNAMRSSVIQNGGFYIARYEAGCTTGRVSSDTSVVIKPLSQQLVYPYTSITWTDAVAASRSMYTKDSYGVRSTLCYGVQWDAILKFLGKSSENNSTAWGNYGKSGAFNFTGEYFTYNNEDWRNDTQTRPKNSNMILQTGATDRNSLKNIYDIAGNVWEWTMELQVYTTASYYLTRGGCSRMHFGFYY